MTGNANFLYKMILVCFCLFIVTAYSGEAALARDSKDTRHGSGPMYWMAYEDAYVQDRTIPEERWKANVDWVAEKFLPYGYDMVSLDGWIEGATQTTNNGYVLSHHDAWLGDQTGPNDPDTWKEWGDYVKNKGLKFGIYYNPLWVTYAAVHDNSKTVIHHPELKVKDIVNLDTTTTSTMFRDPNNQPTVLEGDRFITNQPNSLYWVDVNKPGAEDYVKGYVRYFKDAGASFLRIDFLSWYQTGWDGPVGGNPNNQVGNDHMAEYETALRWIHEAAGDDMTVSLVMPYLKNHGEAELKYGDMVRIVEDVFRGDWAHISGGSQDKCPNANTAPGEAQERYRQTWQDGWSQWANVFQGLTGFSDIGGRGQMVLDSDFIRMHCYGDTQQDDNERKSTISLFTLGGSPIAIADQYDTINNTGSNNERFYQNSEIIALNKLGLVAKPIYNNGNPFEPAVNGGSDTGSRDSERWAGQLPNGEWIVGLFNRSDQNAAKSIDFIRELGLTGEALVRDLWTHSDLGYMTSYSADIAPHDVRMLKVVPRNSMKYEAEAASWIGTKFNNNHGGYTGFGFLDKLEGASVINGAGPKIVFAVEAPETGSYWFNVKYANATGGNSTTTITVKDGNNAITDNKKITLPPTANWDTWANKNAELKLVKGLNLISVERAGDDTGAFNLDYIEFTPHNGNVVTNYGFENGDTSGWTEFHPAGQAAAYGVDSYDPFSGNDKLYFYSPSSYKQSLHQTITGLDNGTYYVTAKVKRQGAAPATARLEVTKYGGSDRFVDIPDTTVYQDVYAKVNVTDGQIDVGFYVDSPGGTSLQVDDVKITRVSLQNGSFKDDFRGWTRSDITKAKIGYENGSAYADITSPSSFGSDLFRFESLQAGTYTLKAKVRRGGTFATAGLYIDLAGAKYKNVNFANDSNWTEVSIPDISLSRDEVVKIGIYAEGDSNAWLHVDQVWLEKN